MATNEVIDVSSDPPELVEILRLLGIHRRKVHEKTYGKPSWTREESDAYWYHPLVSACKWLELRVSIDRHDLETAAFRLTTPLGLRGMDPLPSPNGEPDKEDKGQPDWLPMIDKFRELERDGATAHLWQSLTKDYPAILVDAGLLVSLGDGDEAGRSRPAADSEFQWVPPLMEGYVFALLKEVEFPTERVAVEWIATKSRKHAPSRATLRKTFAWEHRPRKAPNPRTTNEAQCGVSPAENAVTGLSHEELTHAVLDIEERISRQLKDDERAAVAWTLQDVGANEEDQDKAIQQLVRGFKSGNM